MMYAADKTKQLVGNVFQACEIDEQFTTYTFTMRAGLRWSDGSLVTTEDIRFMMDDCWRQEEFYPADYYLNRGYFIDRLMPPWFTDRDKDAETIEGRRGIPNVVILDDLHFQIIYEKPFYKLATLLTQQNAYEVMLLLPSQYLKQFHPFYADNGELGNGIANTIIKNNVQIGHALRGGLEGIWSMMNDAVTTVMLPTLGPWMVVEEDAENYYLERNPYYWKVDTQNQQLPYIDRIRLVMANPEETPNDDVVHHIRYGFAHDIYNMNINGHDFAPTQSKGEQLTKTQKYMDGQHRALTLYDQITVSEGACGLRFLLDTQDEWWQEMVKNQAFRKALCLSVDGERLAQAVGGGQAKPFEGWVYDPETAQTILDQLLPRGANNLRTWGNGPIVLQIMYSEYEPQQKAAAETYAACFEEIGIQCEFIKKLPNGSLRHIGNGAHIAVDISLRTFETLKTYVWQETEFYEIDYNGLRWHATKGEAGREPLPEMKAFYEKMDELMLTPNASIADTEDILNKMMQDGALCYPGVQGVTWPVAADVRLANIVQDGSLQEVFRMAEVWFLK